jgi:hypothetical protein
MLEFGVASAIHAHVVLRCLSRLTMQTSLRAEDRRIPRARAARALSCRQLQKILADMPDLGQGVRGKARDDAGKTKARLAVLTHRHPGGRN